MNFSDFFECFLSLDGGCAARLGCGSLRLPQAVCMCASRHAAVYDLCVWMAAAPPGGDAACCACRRLCACALRAMRLCTSGLCMATWSVATRAQPVTSGASNIIACGRSSHPGFPPVSREVGEVQHKSVVAPDATVLAALSQSTLIVKLSAIVYRVLRMNRWRNRGFFAGQRVCLVS